MYVGCTSYGGSCRPLAKAPFMEKQTMSMKDMLGPLTRALVGVPVTMLGLILDIVNKLSSSDGNLFYTELAKFVKNWRKTVETAKTQILYLLSAGEDLTIGPTTGNLRFEDAKKTFGVFLDISFKNWGLCGSGRVTLERETEVHEMRLNADFSGMFNSLGRPLSELVFTFDEVENFCQKHPEWLRSDGYATFFLLKEDNEFFVADVSVYPYGLNAYVYRFEYSCVWDGEYRHRVVVPQQGLSA